MTTHLTHTHDELDMLAYRRVKGRIRAELGASWKVGDKLPAIEEIARQFNAGRANSYRAIRELADEGLLVSRRRLGTFVVRTTEASAAARSETLPLAGKSVGLAVYPVLQRGIDPFAQAAVGVIEHELQQMGAECSRVEQTGVERGGLMLDSTLDAAVVFNPSSLHRLPDMTGRPLVIINTADEMQIGAAGGYDVISVQNEQGGYQVGKHFRDIGVQRPCFLSVRGKHHECCSRTSLARLAGFHTGWGAVLEEKYIIHGRDYSEAAGARALAMFLELNPRPDAVFAVTDELAVGFITAALSHNLTVGKDFRMAGFDGQQRGRQVFGGPLTTVDTPLAEMGRLAADLIDRRLLNPDRPIQHACLPGTLYVGPTSTGASV